MQNVYKTGWQQTVSMPDKEAAKQELKKLIARYETAVAEGKVKQYNEERTKKDFILGDDSAFQAKRIKNERRYFVRII